PTAQYRDEFHDRLLPRGRRMSRLSLLLIQKPFGNGARNPGSELRCWAAARTDQGPWSRSKRSYVTNIIWAIADGSGLRYYKCLTWRVFQFWRQHALAFEKLSNQWSESLGYEPSVLMQDRE